jgi:ubiquitin carboxyl-terminal hydrolase 4/11
MKEKEDNKEDIKSGIDIDQCLEEFKKPEALDEDNKWYCNKCKDHVLITKSLEIYKLPPVLIISLKRFKAGKSKYS